MENKAVVLKSVWEEQQAEIKKIFGPKLSDSEFKILLELGKSTGANPFRKEIWAVKVSDNEPPAIFLARDFYRKRAAEMPDYEGHYVGVVCANDTFVMGVKENTPTISEHSFNFKDRGPVKMAYCIVYRKGRKPFIVPVELDEYIKRKNDGSVTKFWRKPHMMLSKVAEAAALRMAYPSEFQGTYSEDEDWSEEGVIDLKAEHLDDGPAAPSFSKKDLLAALQKPEFQQYIAAEEARGVKANMNEMYAAWLSGTKLPAAEVPAKPATPAAAPVTQTAPAALPPAKTETDAAANQTAAENKPAAAKGKKTPPKWYKERIICEATPEIKALYKGLEMATVVAIYTKHDGDTTKIIAELKEIAEKKAAEEAAAAAKAAAAQAKAETTTTTPATDGEKTEEGADSESADDTAAFAFEAGIPADEPTKKKKEYKDVTLDVAPIVLPELRKKFYDLITPAAKVLEAFNSFCCYDSSPQQQAKIMADIEARPDYYSAKKGATA